MVILSSPFEQTIFDMFHYPLQNYERVMRNGKCVGIVKKRNKKYKNRREDSLVEDSSVREDDKMIKGVRIGSSQQLSGINSQSQSNESDINPLPNTQQEPNPEPNSTNGGILELLLSTLQAENLRANATDKTPDSLQISDLLVVKNRIHEVVCHLGQGTLTAQAAIRELVDLAIDVDNATEGKIVSEKSGHDKKYIIKVIYDVMGKLGSGTATVSEVITQLIGLATRLSAPPPKVTPPTMNTSPATKPEATKPKTVEPANPPGPVGPSQTKEDGGKTNGAAQELDLTGGKGGGKKKPTRQAAEGGEGTVTSTVPAKTDAPNSSAAGKKKKDDMKGVNSAIPNKKDIPAASGTADVAISSVKTKTEVIKPPSIPTAPPNAEAADVQRVFELKINVNLQEETSHPSQGVNGRGVDGIILPTTAQSLFSAAAPAEQSRGNEQATQPTKSCEFADRGLAESHARVPVQPTQQAGKVWSVDQYGQYYSTGPQAPSTFPIQPYPPGYVNSDLAVDSQASFPTHRTQQAGEIGSPREFGYQYVAESQTPFPAHQTRQAGQLWSVNEIGQYYPTESQYPSTFPLQQDQQDSVNGTPAMQNRETSENTRKPYRSQVPFTDQYGRTTETNPNHPQRPTNEDFPYAYSTTPAYSAPRKPRLQSSLPGQYSPGSPSDSAGSLSSSESTVADWKSTRETKDRAEREERGGHCSRHSSSDRDRSDRAGPRLEEFKPRRGEDEGGRDKWRTGTGRKTHQPSPSRQEAQQSSWTSYLPSWPSNVPLRD